MQEFASHLAVSCKNVEKVPSRYSSLIHKIRACEENSSEHKRVLSSFAQKNPCWRARANLFECAFSERLKTLIRCLREILFMREKFQTHLNLNSLLWEQRDQRKKQLL